MSCCCMLPLTRTIYLLDAIKHATFPISYSKAWNWQKEKIQERISSPFINHRDYLVCLEHKAVYTLGRSSKPSDLLFGKEHTERQSQNVNQSSGNTISGIFDDARKAAALFGADLHEIERGGKVTYHGPGQLVVYPMLHLREPFFKPDLHLYVHKIEEVIIKALAHFGISAERLKGYPGVWVRNKKIAAIGMNCSKWFTSHGFAINVNPDLDAFRKIVPCGINDRDVTSLEVELKLKESLITTRTREETTSSSIEGKKVYKDFPDVNEVKDVVLATFCQEFNCDLDIDTTQLEKMMSDEIDA